MSWTEWLGGWLGCEHVSRIEHAAPSFAARWAQNGTAWVLAICAGLALASWVFYARYQPRRHLAVVLVLALLRTVLLCLVLLFLAEPVLTLRIASDGRPFVWLLFDTSASMAIEDDLPRLERARLLDAVGLPAQALPSDAAVRLSRIGLVQALLNKPGRNLLARLDERFRLEAFVCNRPDGADPLEPAGGQGEQPKPAEVARRLTADGEVTALGAALAGLGRRHGSGQLAGLIVFSDFNENSGPPALGAARALGVPVYTVGVGPLADRDLGVSLQAPALTKRAERSTPVVALKQRGLDGRSATVRLIARRLGGLAGDVTMPVGRKSVVLDGPTVLVDFPFVPDEAGRYVLAAEVELPDGEVHRTHRAQREISVRDDFLRLLSVEYEPTWEWRFLKEVFHRDPLVGQRGFRSYLRSADPQVRQSNELFLPTLALQRGEFFAYDVILLGDMPASALGTRFCEMAREFVGTFGGGLVVVAGPRFGPGQLADTPLAEILPVEVGDQSRPSDQHEFVLRLASGAGKIDFMRLGADEDESRRAWDNLGPLGWYQPVVRLHPRAIALAEHPTDTCVDGRTPQPLVAIRRYGRGEVVYLGFNETWRLRRKHNETYYRRFWGQMIHRLGLSHAVGGQKRFIVHTDRQQYRVDDSALVTVEAYDDQFQPLPDAKFPAGRLAAELIVPGPGLAATGSVQPLKMEKVRRGVFETRLALATAGEYRVRVDDPVTGQEIETRFQVTGLSVERRSSVRNVALAEALARETGGRSFELTNVDGVVDLIKLPSPAASGIEVVPLWNTWLGFGFVVFLMLGEWLVRKCVNLP